MHARASAATDGEPELCPAFGAGKGACRLDALFSPLGVPSAQVLYPPLTYLQPTGRVQLVKVGPLSFKVVEVTPNIP